MSHPYFDAPGDRWQFGVSVTNRAAALAARSDDPALLASRLERFLLWILLILCVVRLWLVPLASSLWVDETVTLFVVNNGSKDPSLAAAPQVRDSAYYVLPRISHALFGASEIAYRLPSTLAMAVALYMIFRIATRIIHVRAGWLAVFACLALTGINYQADDARPYAFGTCIAAIGVYFLVLWLDTGAWRNALGFLLAAAVLWRIHLIFWPFYLVLASYAVARKKDGGTSVSWNRLMFTFGLLGIALAPVIWSALGLWKKANEHVVVPVPSFRDLKRSLQVNLPALTLGAAFALRRLLKWTAPPSRVSTPSLVLILAWWLVHPLCLFCLSHVTGTSLFVTRYLYLCLPGAALTATFAAAKLIPPTRLQQAAIVLGVTVMVVLGDWHVRLPRHHNSDWRTAASRINSLGLRADTPVICPSPFIEARPPVWTSEYRLPGFLYAHLFVYPVNGKPYLLPFNDSAEAESYATSLSDTILTSTARFVIYGGDHNVFFWRDWFAGQTALRGWKNRRLGPFGDVDAVVFENPAVTASR